MQEQCNPYSVINKNSSNAIILTCEHASSYIPKSYNNLGLNEKYLDTHIARDKGCRQLTIALAQKLGCTAFVANCSRLFIDYNRRENEPSLILDESDKILIPGNNNLSKEERNYRIKNYHTPYYQAIFAKIDELKKKGITPKILSIHGYTPQLRGGTYRPWHAGVLFVEENNLSKKILNELKLKKDIIVDANVPYDMRQYNTGSSTICGKDLNLENATIEIRDTEFENLNQGVEKWCSYIAEAILK
ncbi:MAG: hypothetical protein E7005_07315 [Alphaproteobacteria bacterium]|nr:hypothetical protein [Alphaproteobacteria bacterium]